MQVFSKAEQPKSTAVIFENLIQVLERGQESAHHLRNLLHQRPGFTADNGDDDYHKTLVFHSGVAWTSFDTSLSLLKSCGFDLGEIIRKRKIDPTVDDDSPDHHELDEYSGRSGATPKGRRGCYKRRRNDQSRIVEVTTLTDDGHAWRKYGQKVILNATFPRNYYRCTHKHDQECLATKQVQQISENPNKYRIIYYGNHTCKSPSKAPTIIIDPPEENSSSTIFVSFGANNIPTDKHALNPSLFPSSSSSSSSALLTSITMVKQEKSSSISINHQQMASSEPHDLDHHHCGSHNHNHNQFSPSSSSDNNNYLSTSPDPTTTGLSSTTPVSEIYSSKGGPHDMEMDSVHSLFNMDHMCDSLDGLFADPMRMISSTSATHPSFYF